VRDQAGGKAGRQQLVELRLLAAQLVLIQTERRERAPRLQRARFRVEDHAVERERTVVGGRDGAVRPYLPPRPPRSHARVFTCDDAETRALTERLDYLRPLLFPGGGLALPADELVAALLRGAWRARGGDEAFLVRAGRELAALLPRDYDRLRALVNRILG
jgi:hypothetical protein